MNIYIASPLFHKWEQRNVKYIEKWLETIFRGATIYCPQDFQVPNAWELPNHVWAKKIFEEDHKQLVTADNDIGPYSLMCMTADKIFALEENYDVQEIEPQDIEWK